MTDVRRTRHGVRVRLAADEAALLRALMEQLLALIGGAPGGDDELAALGIAENAEKPDDPVLAELLRRYTEMGLRDGKREAAGLVLGALTGDGADVVLDEEQAQGWLRALNDVRLALGTRLDVTEEWYEEASAMDPRDPRASLFAVYDWLTMLQESLVQVLWEPLP